MIDIENYQYTRVKNGVLSLCPNSGTTEVQTTPPEFPYMSFVQKDNPMYRGSMDSDSKENHVNPMIQIDVYTMGTTQKTDCKKIMAKIDETMQADGWERTYGPQPIATGKDYYRMTMRYRGIVSKIGTNNYVVL